MKKTIFLALAVGFAATSALAQSASQSQNARPQTKRWTLDECIAHAVEHNIEVRQASVAVDRAALDLNTTQNSRLPNVSASAGQNYGYGFSDSFGRHVSSTSTSFEARTGITVFEGFRINHQIKSDRAHLTAAAEKLEQARQAVELNVAGFYLDVLLKKEILAVHRDQSALLTQQVANTAAMVAEGKAAPSQLYDIKAELAAAEVKQVGAENDLSQALLDLSQALNLEYSSSFDVAEAPAALNPEPQIPPAEAIWADAVEIKPSVRGAQARLEGSRHGVRVAQSAWWPKIDFEASVSDRYGYVFGSKLPQPSFAEQMRQGHTEGAGLNLSIPIFSRNATRNRVRAAKLDMTNSALELESAKLVLYKEIQQAWQRAVAVRARFDATARALDAADESFRAMELRYGNGKATVFEYSQASTKLISARSEQAQAKYESLFCGKILDFYAGKPITING